MIPKIKRMTSSTVVTTVVTTEHTFKKSPVVVIETKMNGGPSVFTLKRNGPYDSCWTVVIKKDCDFSKLHFTEIWEKHVKFEFKSIEEIDFDDIYYLYTEGHILFDINGDPVPTLNKFDYIGTPFHNECLNLRKAIEVLKNHPWVMNKKDLEIKDIPWFNRDEQRSKYIEVHIYPDKESYKKLYKKSLKKDKEFWSCRMKDMLHDGYCPDKDHNLLGLLECVKPKEEED